MIKIKNKVNIFLILLSLLLVAGSIFAFGYKDKKTVLHADTTTTNFYGSSVYVPLSSYSSNTWSSVNFINSPTSLSGQYIWTDGTNTYFSSGSTQYVLDTSTSTWSTKSWTGLTSFSGEYVWTDGTNIYYSNTSTQYVLDTSTSTWSTKSWTGLTSFNGNNIWTDGTNIYYSTSSKQYVLNGSTWSTKSWTGLTGFSGEQVWTDGTNIYYSSSSNQYVLDTSTSTWSTKSWTGLTSFNGNNIWTDSTNYYYSDDTSQYVLIGSTWSIKIWTGLTSINGKRIWTDGTNIYYSSQGVSYVLDVGIFVTDNIIFDSVNFTFIDNGNDTFSLSHNSLFYIMNGITQNYSISDKFVVYDSNATSYTQNDYLSSVLISSTTGLIESYYIPYSYNGSSYYARLNITCSSLSSVDFVKVDFSSTYSRQSPLNINYWVRNILTYTNSINETISFEFQYFSVGLTPLNYFGDSSQFLYQLFDDPITSIDDYIYCFNSRTYYLNNDYLNSQQYQQGYQSGYSAGERAGYSNGYSAGSSAVSDSQYNAGYSAGYSAGIISANNYSFLGLISAVIDAPLRAFTGLFNFNLLGVNILDFITALFTLAVIITIIKKVI